MIYVLILQVLNNWRNRLGGAPSETDCKQIKHCLEIGLGCIKLSQEERPTSREIIKRLDRWENTNCNVNNEKRPPADQILTHTEEKPSVSTTGDESIFCAVQPNITSVRSTAAEDNNSNTNTGASSLFHRQLLRLLSKDSTEEFTFAQMVAATKGLSPEAKIGEGGFGSVYHGYLPDGREVAIKRGEAKIGEGGFGSVYSGYLLDRATDGSRRAISCLRWPSCPASDTSTSSILSATARKTRSACWSAST
jgi:hypothetical protein